MLALTHSPDKAGLTVLLENIGGRATIPALSGWALGTGHCLKTGDCHSDSHRDAAGKADGGPKPAV